MHQGRTPEGPRGGLLAFWSDGDTPRELVLPYRCDVWRRWGPGIVSPGQILGMVDCLKIGQVEVADGPQRLGGGAVLQAVRQRFQPGGILRLQFCQFGDGVMPAAGGGFRLRSPGGRAMTRPHSHDLLAFAGRNGPLMLFAGVLIGLIAPPLADLQRRKTTIAHLFV